MIIKNKRILVIGGAGFIGSHTVELLLKESPKKIIIFDNFERGKLNNLAKSLKDPRVELFKDGGDILKLDLLNSAMQDVDYVFHFAALWLLHCNDYPESAFDVNIRGTFNVINLCVKNKIKKLIFSSSASVYGDALKNPINENHPFNNKNFYGATKIAGEQMLKAMSLRYNLKFIGLRYMNVYGPRQDSKGAYVSVIVNMIKKLKEKKPIVIFGSGNEKFDFVHVSDCANANIRALKSNNSGYFLNVGTGKGTSLKKLANMISSNFKGYKKIEFKKNKINNLVKNRVGSIVLAKKIIKFNYKINLKVGLKNFIKYFDA
tara:strand:+ start:11381 stop:12334 length:954 start_codon:yes stop_codon:yes gene_type:complete